MGFEIQIKDKERLKYNLYVSHSLIILLKHLNIIPYDFNLKNIDYVRKCHEKAVEKLELEDINYIIVQMYYNRYTDKNNYFNSKYRNYDEDFLFRPTNETMMVYLKLTLDTLRLCNDDDVWFCE